MRAFGELEIAILEIIRKRKKASVKEVHEQLFGSTKYTTVMTVMSRLSAKGALKRKKLGRLYEYWLPPDGAKSDLNILQRIRKKVFRGKSSGMISYLLENDEEISADELKKIEKLIKEAKKKK